MPGGDQRTPGRARRATAALLAPSTPRHRRRWIAPAPPAATLPGRRSDRPISARSLASMLVSTVTAISSGRRTGCPAPRARLRSCDGRRWRTSTIHTPRSAATLPGGGDGVGDVVEFQVETPQNRAPPGLHQMRAGGGEQFLAHFQPAAAWLQPEINSSTERSSPENPARQSPETPSPAATADQQRIHAQIPVGVA